MTEKKKTVVDYWSEQYKANHGIDDVMFAQAEAVILHGLVKKVGARRLAWCIWSFHRIRHDDYVEQAGWSVKCMATRLRGLLVRYAKEVGEPEAAADKEETTRNLEVAAEDPKVVNLLDRLTRDR